MLKRITDDNLHSCVLVYRIVASYNTEEITLTIPTNKIAVVNNKIYYIVM